MTAPRVSIGMPVFNGASYIEEAIDSILSQTFQDFELIISDNASNDDTAAIVEKLAVIEPRIRLIRQDKNMGAAWNYNEVFRRARGTYFRWAPADDKMTSSYLEACVETLDANPDIVLCYPPTRLIGPTGAPIRDYRDRMDLRSDRVWRRAGQYILRIGLCNAVLGLHRKETLARTRLIQPFVGSDAVLLFECVLAGKVGEVLGARFERRVHPEGSHEANRSREALERWFAPGKKIRLRVPVGLRLLAGYMEAVTRAPLSKPDRLLVGVAVMGCFSYKRLRIALGRMRRSMTGERSAPGGRWAGLTDEQFPPGPDRR